MAADDQRTRPSWRQHSSSNDPVAGCAQDVSPEQTAKTFTWGVHWGGLPDGLRYSLWTRVEVGGPEDLITAPVVREELSLNGKIGAKLAVDGAAFVTTGSLAGFDDGIELRRARLYTTGDIHVLIPMFYKVEFSLQGDTVVRRDHRLRRPSRRQSHPGNVQTPWASRPSSRGAMACDRRGQGDVATGG